MLLCAILTPGSFRSVTQVLNAHGYVTEAQW